MLSVGIWDSIVHSFTINFIQDNRYTIILDGLESTLIITFFAVLLGTLIGGLICWMRMSRHSFPRAFARFYIDLMRGTPVLVLLMIMYYIVLAPAHASGVLVAIITFAMNTAAYMCEMLRTSIEGVDRGQTEAGLSLGFSKVQTFFLIVLPQAVRKVIPVYQGEVVSLLKSTSIVGYVAVIDMTKASDMIRSRTFDAFFPLISIALVYFLIAWLIGLLLSSLSKPRKHKIGKVGLLVPFFAFLMTSCASSSTGGQILSEQDVDGRSIAVIQGSIAEQYVLDHLRSSQLMSFNNDVDAIQALLTGKAEVVFLDDIVAMMPAREHPQMRFIPSSVPPMPIAACFPLGDKSLSVQFRDFIAELDSTGAHKEILSRWQTCDLEKAHRDIPDMPTSGQPLTVSIMATMPPMEFVSNDGYDGYEIELLRLFSKKIGRPVKFINSDFGSILPSIVAGKADMAACSISQTAEREKMLTMVPYFESTLVYVVIDKEGQPVAEEAEASSLPYVVGLLVLAGLCAVAVIVTGNRRRRQNKGNPSSAVEKGDVIMEISHLSKTFGGTLHVLKDVSATIRKGEVISIIGPSGTGKSTFLRCLNLLETPDTGSILVGGNDILSPDADVPALRRKMVMVFQSFNLFNDRTVLENVTFAPIRLLKKEKEEALSKGMELLDLVGLASKAYYYPDQLSGGQKQRVAIAR
ncbi:MAG: ABC transporter permease subunit, partial [Bacteroidales bacterium]|nr:ABC transporter permease subunit [Bacteroidales bacterium]